tara:strand:+ start:457 stop:1770 length:1314 start_codon:yes stop_codon:yes gene_type:complete
MSDVLVPGQAELEEVLLVSENGAELDVTRFVANVFIYSSIYHKTVTGQIGLIESQNIKRHFMLNGDEKVKLKFKSKGMKDSKASTVNLIMQTYKNSGSTLLNNTTQIYTIFLDSPIIYENLQGMETGKQYYEDTGDELIRNIFDRHLNNGDQKLTIGTKKPVNLIKFVAPLQWKPLETIQWISRRCVSPPPKSDASYIFFQTVDEFKFTNLAELVSQDPIQEYSYYEAGLQNTKDDGERFYSIENLNMLDTFDRPGQISNGVFNNTILKFDMTFKDYSSSLYNYKKQFENQTHLEKEMMVSDSEQRFSNRNILNKIMFVPQNSYLYDEIEDIDVYEGWLGSRQSIMNQYRTNKINVRVPGNSSIRAGEVIEIKIPAIESKKKKNDKLDPYLSGKYLVASVRHELTQNDNQVEYKTSLSLIRDTLPKPIPDEKEVSSG